MDHGSSSRFSEAGRFENLDIGNRDNQMVILAEPSSQPTGENQFILFQCHCLFSLTRNWIPPRQSDQSPREQELPSEPRTPTKPPIKFTFNKYSLNFPQHNAEVCSVSDTQDNLAVSGMPKLPCCRPNAVAAEICRFAGASVAAYLKFLFFGGSSLQQRIDF